MVQNAQAMAILEDIQDIYKRALESDSLGIALRAKELMGKEFGLFKSKSSDTEFTLENIPDHELSRIIDYIEKQLKL